MAFFYFVCGAAAMAGLLWLVRQRFGFTSQSPADYAGGPAFDIRDVLNGTLLCDGIIYGPAGRVTSRFTARIEAEWTGDNGVMRERFVFDSGAVQNREWRLSVGPEGDIEADADDLAGPGFGWQQGSSVKLAYRIRLTESAGGYVLDVVDWMYLLENGSIMNRSQFRKFGFKVGELVATMRPDPGADRNGNRKAA